MITSDSDQSPVVCDLGQIACFRLPPSWKEVPQEKSEWSQRSYCRDFSPPDDPSAVLSVYFRGFMVSEGSAQRFRSLLQGQGHKLNTEEIDSINQVLSKLADQDAFELRSVLTGDIGGRGVLIIDGEWKTSQTQFHGLMLGADDSGREIQEIFFEAPVTGFMKYLNVVVDSIRTIEWKGCKK